MKHIGMDARMMMRACAISAAPREACGILIPGLGGVGLNYVPSTNMAADYLSYSIDPEIQRKYIGQIEGVFHSHVSRSAQPSDVDGGLAVGGLVYVIYSIVDDEFRFWRMVARYEMRDSAGAKVSSPVVWEELFDTSFEDSLDYGPQFGEEDDDG